MFKQAFMLFVLVTVLMVTVSCGKDKDDINQSFDNETEFYDWLYAHNWGIGANVMDSKDGVLNLDIFIGYYQDYSEVDYDADYSLTINGVDCPVIASQQYEDIYTDDASVPYSNTLHFVFKIDGQTMVDKSVSVPSQPSLSGPTDLDFSQANTFSWTLAHSAEIQFFYGYVYAAGEGHYINELLRNSARSFVLPANTVPSTEVSGYGFSIEESNISEHHDNLVVVSKIDDYGYFSKKDHQLKSPFRSRKHGLK